jgi:predicted RNase H-like nuclease (RuvC/YqgF family)
MQNEEISQGQFDGEAVVDGPPTAEAVGQRDDQTGTATEGQQPSGNGDATLEALRSRADQMSKDYRHAQRKISSQGDETSQLRHQVESMDNKIQSLESQVTRSEPSNNDYYGSRESGDIDQNTYNQATSELVDVVGELRREIGEMKSGSVRNDKQQQYMAKFGVSAADATRAIDMMAVGDDVSALELLNAASIQSKLQQRGKDRQSQAREVAESVYTPSGSASPASSGEFDYNMTGKSPSERAAALAQGPSNLFDRLAKGFLKKQ